MEVLGLQLNGVGTLTSSSKSPSSSPIGLFGSNVLRELYNGMKEEHGGNYRAKIEEIGGKQWDGALLA